MKKIFIYLSFYANTLFADPVITVGALSGSPVTSNGQLTACIGAANSINTTNFLYLEGIPTYFNQNPFSSMVTCQAVTGGTPHKIAIEFMCDAASFELKFAHKAGWYRLSVDEGSGIKYIGSSSPVQAYSSAATNAIYYINVDYSGVTMPRRYYLETSPTGGFIGVYSNKINNVYKSSVPSGPLVFVMGDSWVAGSVLHTDPQLFDGIPEYLGRLMGWRNVVASGAGGTGFLANGSNTYRSRIAADVLAYSPNIIVIASTYNDDSFTQAQEQAEVTLVINQIKAANSKTMIAIVGSWTNVNAQRTTAKINVAAGAAAACALYPGVLYIDPIGNTSDLWGSGTGNNSSPTGVGNSDVYINSSTHPLAGIGDKYFASRIFQFIQQATALGTFY